jgi:hypothetical protein
MTSLSSKRPAKPLEDLKREKKKSGYDKRLAENSSSSLIYGGYMRRMASLNASARVSALMEPEKKYKNTATEPHKFNSNEALLRESRKSWSISSSDDLSIGIPSPTEDFELPGQKDLSLSPARFYGSSSTSSEADVSKDSDEILGAISEPGDMYKRLLALAALHTATTYDLDEIRFNTLGLLYSGDTIHPSKRVFYTSDTDFSLPDRIIPRVVPSQEKFLGPAIRNALAQRSAGKKRRGAKVSYL